MKQHKLGKLYSALSLLTVTTLAACSSGNNTSAGATPSPSPIVVTSPAEITVNTSAAVPVVNGFNTAGKIFLHNNSNRSISGIKVSLEDTSLKTKMSKLLSYIGLSSTKSITDKHGFILLNEDECATIAANSECSINFVTPGLKAGGKSYAVTSISYTGAENKNVAYNAIVNYEYANTEQLPGVNFFGGTVPAVADHGGHAYVTGYILGGGTAGTVYDNVALNTDKPNDIVLLNGFANGNSVASGQVIPVEFEVNMTNNFQNGGTVTPTYYTSNNVLEENSFVQTMAKVASKSSLKSDDGGLLGTSLFVSVLPLLPTQSTTNLVFGGITPIDVGSSSTSITVINNGNATLAAGQLQVNVSAPVTASTTCSSTALSPYAANTCTVTFTLGTTSNETGSVPVTYTVGGVTVGQDTLYYATGNQYASLYINSTPAAVTTAIDYNKAESKNVTYTLTNSGTESATIVSITPVLDTSSLMTQSQTSTTCPAVGSTLNIGASCTVVMKYTAGNTSGSGSAHLNAQISYPRNGTTEYASFQSLPYRYRVVGYPSLSIANIATLLTNANGFQVESTTTVVTNTGSESAILDTLALANVSGYSTIQPAFESTGGPWCAANQVLAPNGTCTVKVKYGPIPYTESANQSGVESLVINYHGGYPNVTPTATKSFNYSFVGNDAYVEVSAVTLVGSPSGSGTSASPWQASGSTATTQGVTLTYQNKSANYSLKNFMVNTNNLPLGLQRTGGTCATTSPGTTLAASGTCTVQLTVNKDYETRVNNAIFTTPGGSTSGLTLYPTASWNVDESGTAAVNVVYTQPAVYKTTNESGIFMTYTQLNMNYALSANGGPTYGTSPTVVLTINPTQTSGYSSIAATVSRVDRWLESTPTTASSGCTVLSDYSVSCTGIAAAKTITYYMPNYLNTGESADIPLVYGATANTTYIYQSPAWQFIKYTK